MGISKYENAAAVDEALDKGVEAFEKTQGGFAAENIAYDNTESGIEAENVQSAIDVMKDEFYTEITHVNTSLASKISTPEMSEGQIATIGQVLAVKAVDESGKPTEWEVVDQSGGGSGYAPKNYHIAQSAKDLVLDVSYYVDNKACLVEGQTNRYSIPLLVFATATVEIYGRSSYSSVPTFMELRFGESGSWVTQACFYVSAITLGSSPTLIYGELAYNSTIFYGTYNAESKTVTFKNIRNKNEGVYFML